MSLFAAELQAQVPETWDLRRCVEYAMKNNISVRQSEVDIRGGREGISR